MTAVPGHRDVMVAVIGGGPAGLAAATEIASRNKGKVVLLERDHDVGGIPPLCGHSPFGMREFHRILSGKRYARRLAENAVAAGVEILIRHSVLSLSGGLIKVATPDGPLSIRAQKVVLATGIRETPRSSRLVSGDRPIGVINTGALQHYVHRQKLAPFRRPVIIGTELVSMSAILTCFSGGIRPVAIIEAAKSSTARLPFSLLPNLLRIPRLHDTKVIDIQGRPRVENIVVETRGQQQSVACDGIIFTGDFVPESSLARAAGLEIDIHTGGPRIDPFGRTSDPHIFAAGNLLRPVETAGWCWAEGRRIAENVLSDLAGSLPPHGGGIDIVAGDGIKLVMPQSIVSADAANGMPFIQVRLSKPVQGTLSVSDGERILWSRSIDSAQERRILIPVDQLKCDPSVAQLVINAEDRKGLSA